MEAVAEPKRRTLEELTHSVKALRKEGLTRREIANRLNIRIDSVSMISSAIRESGEPLRIDWLPSDDDCQVRKYRIPTPEEIWGKGGFTERIQAGWNEEERALRKEGHQGERFYGVPKND